MLDAVISSEHSYLLLYSVGKYKVQIVLLSSSSLLCYLISFISILILALAFFCTFRFFFLFVKSLPLCLIEVFIFIKEWRIDMCTSGSLIICTDSESHPNLIWEAHKESVPLRLCIPTLWKTASRVKESGLIWVFEFKVACSFPHTTQYEVEIW